ncbi:unnamed protein product, partial [Thlaspi arvense]
MRYLGAPGVEVKVGQPPKVELDVGRVIHISQAALGEGKKEKGSELIPLCVRIIGDNFIVGSLSAKNVPQVSFDLVFEKAFELCHNWKNGSVYFYGYSTDNPFVYPSNCFNIDSEDEDEDEDVPLAIPENAEEAKPAANKAKASKPESSAKPKVTVEPKKDESNEDDETEEDEDEDESDDE